MTKTMFKKLNFPYQHPLFKRSTKSSPLKGVYYEDSVYYSWFQFLRRNKEYEDTCRFGGEGRLNGLYKDFGDVFNVDFKTWWKTDDRGATLFANALPPEFKIINDSSEFIENPNVIYIQIPLELPKSFLHQKLKEVLSDNHIGRIHRGKRGVRTNLVPTAKYPVSKHFYKEKLKKYLEVYDFKNNNPKLKLWEIAIETKNGFLVCNPLDSESEIKRQKTVLANTTKRILKKVDKLIAGTSEGLFPIID